MTNILVVERRIAAPPSAVYRYLTESERWATWQGESATVDAVPGGSFRMRMASGMVALGEFVELVPNARVVFTWGWVDHPGLPPGSTTVEIDLIPDGSQTLVRLTHRDLPPDQVSEHRIGWEHYLPRLARAAEGSNPGADPGPSAAAV